MMYLVIFVFLSYFNDRILLFPVQKKTYEKLPQMSKSLSMN